jgi:hypothetical protein
VVEKRAWTINGFIGVLGALVLLGLSIYAFVINQIVLGSVFSIITVLLQIQGKFYEMNSSL